MKIKLCFLSLVLTMVGIMNISAEELKNGTFRFGEGKNQKGHLYLPEKFEPSKSRLIVFMHGRGSAPGTAGNVGTPDFEAFRKICAEKGYVIAVPPGLSLWFNAQVEKDVCAMLDYLAKNLKIDTSRFYLAGCSMGGMSALLYAGRHSERVIAVCDIFGAANMGELHEGEYKENIKIAYGGYYADRKAFYESRNAMNYVSVLKNIPILIIHGEADEKVPIRQSRELLAEIKKAGGTQIELIAVPKIGHANRIIKGYEQKVVDFFEAIGN